MLGLEYHDTDSEGEETGAKPSHNLMQIEDGPEEREVDDNLADVDDDSAVVDDDYVVIDLGGMRLFKEIYHMFLLLGI